MVKFSPNLKFTRDNNESLFTILIYDTDKEKFLLDLKKRLEKIKDIKNAFKRQKLNDRLYKFIVTIENTNKDIFNSIFLVSDTCEQFDLTDKEIKMLREYSIPQYTFEFGEYFKIDWLVDLFDNFDFYDVVIFNSGQYTHFNGNLNKKKKINQTSSQDYIKNLNTSFYLIGKIPNFKPIKQVIEHIQNNITWQEIMEVIRKNNIKKLVTKFDDFILGIQTNPDKFIFGSDVYEQIENYNIKELWLHKEQVDIFNKNVLEKNLLDNINFNIIIIETIDKKIIDGSTKLLGDFGGMVGEKYY